MEINIWDLPADKFYIKLNRSFVEYVMGKIKLKYDTDGKFCSAKHISRGTFFGWNKNCLYPLSIMIQFCKDSNIELKEMQENVVEIRSGRYPSKGGNQSSPIYPTLPIKISLEIVRLIAHMLGDGCVTVNKYGYYNFQYYNQNKKLIEMFRDDARKVFGNLHIHEAVNKRTPYLFLPAPVAIIFLYMVKDFHSKTSSLPGCIKNADLEFKKEFLKAIFDDEASVRKYDRRIEFALANKKLVNEIKLLIEAFGIKTTKVYERTDKNGKFKAYFYIRNYHNTSKFYSEIGFYHPDKKGSLEEIVKFPGRKSYAHGETKEIILNILGKTPSSVFELSKHIERRPVTVEHFLRKLKEEKKVEVLKFDSKSVWKVIK